MSEKLTGDEYMELLQRRLDEYVKAQRERIAASGVTPRLSPFPPLLTWFIRPGDEDLVELPPDPAPKVREPRQYRPASYWRERVAAIEAEMEAVAARASVGDRAAAGGCALGPKRTAAHQKRADQALSRYVELDKKLQVAKGRLCSAQAREARHEGARK
jgi:hypothetical protein